MPRIRTLKPEHRQHRKIGPLDHITYRLWVGMLCEADDEGRLVCELDQLRATVFPYHPEVDTLTLDKSIRTLTRLGLLQRYFARGTWYAAFRSWSDHQRIDHPSRSKLPAPPTIKATITESLRRAVAQRYYEVAGVPPELDRAPLSVDCHHCHMTGGRIAWVLDRPSFAGLELDHLIPESQGGETSTENMVLACRNCNRSRTEKTREDSRRLANNPGGSRIKDQGSRIKEGIKDQGSEWKGREGSVRGGGKPTSNDFVRVLEQIRERHPELSNQEAENHALGEIGERAKEKRG